jgi:hypothetical protein
MKVIKVYIEHNRFCTFMSSFYNDILEITFFVLMHSLVEFGSDHYLSPI